MREADTSERMAYMAARRMWLQSARTNGASTAKILTYVEFLTPKEAEQCRNDGILPEDAEFFWMGATPLDRREERTVLVEFSATLQRVIE
jgi:hypothetical protein